MAHIFELNLAEFNIHQDFFPTLPTRPSLCVCCLDKNVPFIKLINCKHISFFESFFQYKMEYLEMLVCHQCHGFLKKVDLFRQQVEESFDILKDQSQPITMKRKFQNLQKGPTKMLSVVQASHVLMSTSLIPTPLSHKRPIRSGLKNKQIDTSSIFAEHSYQKPFLVTVKSESINEPQYETRTDIKIESETCSDFEVDESLSEWNKNMNPKAVEFIQVDEINKPPKIINTYSMTKPIDIKFKPVHEVKKGTKPKNMDFTTLHEINEGTKWIDIECKPVLEMNKTKRKDIEFTPVLEMNKTKRKDIEFTPVLEINKTKRKDIEFAPVLEMNKTKRKDIEFAPVLEMNKTKRKDIEFAPVLEMNKTKRKDIEFAPVLEMNKTKRKDIEFTPVLEMNKANRKDIEFAPVLEMNKGTQLRDIKIVELKPAHKSYTEAQPIDIEFKPANERYQDIVKMVTLTKEELMLERDKDRLANKYLKHPHKCESCIRSYEHKIMLQNHMTKRHTMKPGAMVCNLCKYVFATIPYVSEYKAHMKRHFRRYECVACGKRNLTLDGILGHCRKIHDVRDSATLQCHRCDYTTESERQLRYHNHRYKKEPVPCPQCDNKYCNATGLRAHILIAHEGSDGVFTCKVCGKVYNNKAALKWHCDAEHDGDAGAYYCAPCDTQYCTERGLEIHLKTNSRHIGDNDKRFVCDECGKRYLYKCKLQEHIVWVHLKRHTHTCTKCSKTYLRKSDLTRHTMIVHEKEAVRRRDKICHHCGRGFTTNTILESHIRTHTGERPLQCARCPATFAHAAARYTHNKLVHQRKRPAQQLAGDT